MLQSLRNNLQKFKWLLWLVIFGTIGGLVVMYGTVRGGKDEVPPGAMAKVNGIIIPYRHYQDTIRFMQNMYRQIYGENFDQFTKNIDFESLAYDEVIKEALLVSEAQKRGIMVDEDEITMRIVNTPMFQNNGVFDQQRYRQILAMNRMSPQEFEENLRINILTQKMEDLIKDMVVVSKGEVWESYINENEKIKLKLVLVPTKDYLDEVTVTPKEIEQYYNQHASDYQIPTKVRLDYFAVTIDWLKEKVKITEQDAKDYYNMNLYAFTQPEKIKARHILFKLDAEADPQTEEMVRNRAESVLGELKQGADFAKMAEKYSEDESTAPSGGDLGFFGRGEMVPQFEQAAFALQAGEMSDLVRTRFGYHIIKVDEIQPEETLPYEQVKQECIDGAKTWKAEEQLDILSRKMYYSMIKGEKFHHVAADYNLQVVTTELFDAENVPSELAKIEDLKTQAFTQELNKPMPPFMIPQEGAYFTIPIERIIAHQASLEEARVKIETELIEKKAKNLAKQQAFQYSRMLTEGMTWDEMVDKFDLKERETRDLTRNSFVTYIGNNAKFDQIAFSMQPGEVGEPFEAKAGWVLFKVMDKVTPDPQAFDESYYSLYAKLLKKKQKTFFDMFVEELKDDAEIISYR